MGNKLTGLRAATIEDSAAIFTLANQLRLVLIASLIAATTACGSGDVGGSADVNDTSGESVNNGVNGPITGTIVFNDGAIDLGTGGQGYFPAGGNNPHKHKTTATRNGRLILGIYECVNIQDYECLELHDSRRNSLAGFGFDERISERALEINDDASRAVLHGLFNTRIYIMELPAGGGFQQALPLGDRINVRRAAFAPDGTIYYTKGFSIYRVGSSLSDESTDTVIYSFEDDAENGSPQALSVSPDGSMIAVDRGRSGSVWLIGTDGSGARPFITSNHDVHGVRWPVWSPDGSYILAAVNPGFGNLTGAAQRGLVAFDTSYQLHATTLTGDLEGDGRVVLRYDATPPLPGAEGPTWRRITSQEINAWSPDTLLSLIR